MVVGTRAGLVESGSPRRRDEFPGELRPIKRPGREFNQWGVLVIVDDDSEGSGRQFRPLSPRA